jgi:EAL domain-containing protein (putative c-di-GMP-specific phosphodiesterase class I)
VVAEGVERPQDLAGVRDLGVQAAQGFLLGKPSTNRDDLARWTAPAPPWSRSAAFRRVGR